jgi:predicted nuclease of predicted toxin-antitoxin system
MPAPALLVDEDVRVMLADILRQRGYIATHVLEIGRGGRSDADQLQYAAKEDRTVLTHNIRDYLVLDKLYRARQLEHAGIVVSDQLPLRELLRRTLRFLSRVAQDDARNRVIWLHDYK